MYFFSNLIAFGDRKTGMWKSYRGGAKMQFLFLIHMVEPPTMCTKIFRRKNRCVRFFRRKKVQMPAP